MSRHFAAIAYTPGVRASQRQYGGRDLGEGLDEVAETPTAELGPREREFIAARDSFYLSTVNENGNRQYVSVGNLSGNDRSALILMDYPNRRRLKILGRVEMLDLAAVNPKLLEKMKFSERNIERIMLIQVAAFDWNCSRHITPRFTESEWQSR